MNWEIGLMVSVAMKKMATSNVLIVGMKGLGVEIGKLSRLRVALQ